MTRQRRSRRAARYGILSLLWRQFGSERAATATVAAVVLTLAFLSAAAPRVLETITGEEITAAIAELPPTGRDLAATLLSAPELGPSAAGATASGASGSEALPAELDAVWGAFDDALAAIRAGLPPEARATTSPARYVTLTTAVSALDPAMGEADPESKIAFLADPRMTEQVTLTEGRWPAESLATGQPGAVEILLSVDAADRLGWAVGESRTVPIGASRAQAVVLSGLFEPIDAASDYWQHMPTTLTADVFDDGNRRPVATAHAYLNPASWPVMDQLRTQTPGMLVQSRMWFAVDGRSITGSTASVALRQFRQATSTVQVLGPAETGDRVTFFTDAVDALDAVVSRSSATTSVLLIAAIGPFAVAVAVLVLAGRLIAERRRPTLSLIAARGGTGLQLRSVLAIEGLVIGMPSAIVGTAAAMVLVPTGFVAAGVLVPLAVGLAPAAVLAVAASPGAMRRSRTDLADSRTSRLRIAAELGVAILAALSVTLLLVRGIGEGSTGVDPLLVATPLLLSLAASAAVLRLYPQPLAALERRLRNRRGFVAFLGTARSLRDPVAGLTPVLAMVVALSVAVFSSVILSTLDAGVARAAQSRVGAELRASGPIFGDELAAAIAATPGVSAAVPVFVSATEQLTRDGGSASVTVLYADVAALAGLQSGLADAAPAPAGTGTNAGTNTGTAAGGIPLVMSRSLIDDFGAAAGGFRLAGLPVTVTAVTDRIAGSGATGDWVLVDRSWSDELSASGFLPRVLLVGFDSAAGGKTAVDGVRAAVEEAIGTPHATTTIDEIEAGIRSSAFVSGLHSALAIIIALVGALSALAIVLVSTINTRNRTGMLAVLRVLGASPRQSAALVLWELAPVAATACVAGAALGFGLPLVVLAGVELRDFTGGAVQPTLSIDLALTALLIGGFILVVAAASAHAVITSRRVHLANALRTGEE